jgi:RNA polymerase sigma-70 factor (ECF subfamily)
MTFKDLVDKHSRAVMNTAIRILRDPQKAQDVHQEVFLKILRRWHKFKSDVNWPAYLYRTTVRTAVDFAKDSKAVSPPGYHPPNPAKEERPDWRLRAAELQQKLVTCLAKLPKRQADVFVLSRIEGLGYDRVAGILGCSQETVRVHLHRALKRLARELSEILRK